MEHDKIYYAFKFATILITIFADSELLLFMTTAEATDTSYLV